MELNSYRKEHQESNERDFLISRIKDIELNIENRSRIFNLNDEEFFSYLTNNKIKFKYSNDSSGNYDNENEFKVFVFEHHLKRERDTFKPSTTYEKILDFYKTKLWKLPQEKQEIEDKTKITIPYKIALLKEIGFFELDFVKKLTKENQYKLTHQILGGSVRSIKGNILVLNPSSTEDRSKYTSENHFEDVKNYLLKLK